MVETIKGRVFEIAIVWGSQAEAPSGLARPPIIEIEVIGAAKRRSESPERAQHNSPGR